MTVQGASNSSKVSQPNVDQSQGSKKSNASGGVADTKNRMETDPKSKKAEEKGFCSRYLENICCGGKRVLTALWEVPKSIYNFFRQLCCPCANGAKTEAKPDTAKADAPKADAPKADAPKADTPKADAPKVDAPKVDAAKADAAKADAPKADAAKADAPKADAQGS